MNTDQIEMVRAEITRTRAARRPIDDVVADALRELDGMVDKQRAAPGHWPLPMGTFSSASFRAAMLGMFGAVAPAETRAMIEAATRASEKAWPGLRLTERQQQQQLEKLGADLRRLEAAAELERRERERANPDTVQQRSEADPAVWSLTTPELQQLARG